MKALATILTLLAFLPALHAQKETLPPPVEVVLMETVSKYCSEHPTEFSDFQQQYLDHVIAEKGNIYPTSGPIFSPSNRAQERANQIAFYILVRQAYGDTLITLTDTYLVFKTNKPTAPTTK